MNQFEIRSDLPMPSGHDRRRIDYPFALMRIGECLVVAVRRRPSVAKKAKEFMDAHPGWRFETRVIESKTTVGFWCTARPDEAATPALAVERPGAPISSINDRLRDASKLTQPGTRRVVRR